MENFAEFIDTGILAAVEILNEHGFETFESRGEKVMLF
jgi:hypothetical protein